MRADRWELVGEDYDCVCHDGLLPLDWRTKAASLLWWRGEVGDWGAALAMARDTKIRPEHGVECWATPVSGWYGSTWITAEQPTTEPPGWLEMDDQHELCDPVLCDSECAGRPDILCLGLDDGDPLRDVAVGFACAMAPASVTLITAGVDDVWMSRVVRPVTVVRLT